MNRKLLALLCCVLPAPFVHALDTFQIKDIRVQGLERISVGTLFNYLPVKIGDTLTDKLSQDAVRALFKTGFFKDVRLERDGGVLVVEVVERPSIASMKIEGTSEFKDDDLKKILREVGLVEGRVFNRSLLDQVEQELRSQYFARSFYGISVKTKVTQLERNRVDIQIDIVEGKKAIIRDINIVGNSVFKTDVLLDEFELGPTAWWAVWATSDKYSKQVLGGDLERLRQFYQDRGYLEFSITSTQVSITPDKRNIYITVSINEGKKYSVNDVKLGGKFPVPEAELQKLIVVRKGGVFARKDVTETTKLIQDRLANEGYAFANVNAIPDVDKQNARVSFTFFVDPGKRVYVRRVNFAGNLATRDEVLRRELRQQEGAWYAADKIQRSRGRVQRLPYIEEVTVETPAVPGTTDQVDMNLTVKERASGNLMVGVGYSDQDKVTFTASITEGNLFGTGNELSASFDNSAASSRLMFRYTDPYYTRDGVSRSLFVTSQEVDTSTIGTAAYNTKNVGAGVSYGIPLSEDRSMTIGASFDRNVLGEDTLAHVAQRFITNEGTDNSVYQITLGWADDTLDASTLPTKGSFQRLTGEFTLPGSDLTYYKLTYSLGRYWPITDGVSFKLKGTIGYGDGYGDTKELPFYKNFYAGGSSTVRGYKASSLGPIDIDSVDDKNTPGDTSDDEVVRGQPIGGDRRVLVNSELSFPVPGTDKMDKVMRMALFIDGGMAYGYRFEGTGPNEKAVREDMDLGELRYSAGLAFNWFAPIGPISMNVAFPLNDRKGDKTENFQFTIGVPLQ